MPYIYWFIKIKNKKKINFRGVNSEKIKEFGFDFQIIGESKGRKYGKKYKTSYIFNIYF